MRTTDKASYKEYVSKCRRQREKIRTLIHNIDIDRDLIFEIKAIEKVTLQ